MKFIDNLPSMDLMRSEKLILVQLIIPVESAHRAVSYLGELGLMQFRDVRSDLSLSLNILLDETLVFVTSSFEFRGANA